jgi:hypothetical protein
MSQRVVITSAGKFRLDSMRRTAGLISSEGAGCGGGGRNCTRLKR